LGHPNRGLKGRNGKREKRRAITTTKGGRGEKREGGKRIAKETGWGTGGKRVNYLFWDRANCVFSSFESVGEKEKVR